MQRHGGRWAVFVLIVGFALAAGLSACKTEREDAAAQLLSAFANGCRSQGEWTQVALSQTRALEQAIRSLQDNEKCSGVANALGSVQSLTQELERLSKDPSAIGEKEALETKRQLLIELSQATDATSRAALTSALAEAEVALAQARAAAAVSLDEQGNSSMVRGMSQLSGYLSTLLASQAGLSECSRDHPMLGVQLGAGALAIAGTFVAPPVGAAVAAAGQLLSGVVDFARREGIARKLKKVKVVELEAALACGLESMSNTYCGAQDIYSLIRLQAESYPEQWQPTRFWAGLDLWSRKVPRLLSWVNKVATGLTPTDPATAERQNEVWSKVHRLQSIERTVEGIIAQTERLLQSPPETERAVGSWQEKITRHALAQIVYSMFLPDCGRGGCTPIAEYYTTWVSLLYKVAQDSLPPSNVSEQRTVDTIELPPRGFADVRDHARVVFAEVSQQLMANLHLVVDVDPSGLLRDALMPEAIGQDSPLGVARELITFLDESAKWFESMGTDEAAKIVMLIRETQALLADSVALVLTAPGEAVADRKVIIELFDKLQLIYGTDFLAGRIYRHIKWDLNTRIEKGQFPQDVAEILRASGKDAARELTGAVGGGSLDALLQDISQAQSISQRNVENFVDLFEDGLESSLKRLREAANRAGEPMEGPHRPNRMVQARICTLVLTTSYRWPKNIDRRLCRDAVLESIYPGIPEKLRFDELEGLLAGQPLEKRMCTYQHFLRRSRLYASKPPGA